VKTAAIFATLIIITTLVLAGVGLYFHPGGGYGWMSYVDPWLMQIVRFSIWQAALSAFFAVLIALPLAWCLAGQAFHGQWLVKGLLNLFFIMPVLTIILGVVAAFSDWFNVFSLEGILLAHLYLNVPYAMRIFWERLSRIAERERQLGRTLGFSRWHQFIWLEWPVLRQALKPVFTMIFLLCFSSFTIVLTLGGGPANTNLEVAIYQALKFDFDPQAGVLYAVIHALIAFGLMWFLGRRQSLSLELDREKVQRTLAPSRQQGIVLALLLALLLYPLLALLLHGLSAPWQGSQRLTQAIVTSLMLAFGSGSFALLLALLRSFSRNDNRIMRFLDFGLLVMPIMVITTGLFLLALRLNIAFKITGLLIIWLNGLMAMPLIVSPLASRVKVFRARYDHLALSLDMSSWAQFRLIYWPALRATLPWCLTLAIVLSVGDLGIAALIGSAQFVTLPILIYQAMGSYQMVLASQLTLVLLLICGALLVAAEWFSERNRHA